jgi:superfamily II DNA/RNA helicase
MQHQEILQRMGFTQLTPMQTRMYEEVSKGKDLVLLSPTGSGKTMAFLLPIVSKLEVSQAKDNLQIVVILPSRELAQQTDEVFKRMKTPFRSIALHGGRPTMEEHRKLNAVKPHVIFSTPGRLNDHLTKENIVGGLVTTLVIDEFDKCLELGFQAEMEAIMKQLRFIKQVVFTSATALHEEQTEDSFLFKRWCSANTLDFIQASDDAPKNTVTWHYTLSPQKDKLNTLAQLLTHLNGTPAIVFVAHRESAERIYDYLKSLKFYASCYHGGMQQEDRERSLYKFRAGSTNVLVSTDLAARGLDIPEVGAVVHYHLPADQETLTHRSGRTARWTASGTIHLILGPEERLPECYPATAECLDVDDVLIKACPSQWTTLYIGRGKRDKLSKMDIVGFLCKKGGCVASDIGRIDVAPNYAYVAVNRDIAPSMLKQIKGEKIKGMKTLIEEMRK